MSQELLGNLLLVQRRRRIQFSVLHLHVLAYPRTHWCAYLWYQDSDGENRNVFQMTNPV